MFLMHVTDPKLIDNTDYFDLMELLSTPDEDPIFSASELLSPSANQEQSFYDQDDIWADE